MTIRVLVAASLVAGLAMTGAVYAKPKHVDVNDVIAACQGDPKCDLQIYDDGTVIGTTENGVFACYRSVSGLNDGKNHECIYKPS